MHIAKSWERKDKFKDGLGGLQEGLNYGPHWWIIATMGMVGLTDNIIGLTEQSMNYGKPIMEDYLDQFPLREEYFKVILSHHYCL